MSELERRPTTNEQMLLWATVLLPPIIWAVQMEINYAFLRRACSAQRNVAMPLTTLVALALTILTAVLAWTSAWPFNRVASSTRFVGILGLLSSAIFFATILAQGLATLMFHPCQL
jgi:hypothetical protein